MRRPFMFVFLLLASALAQQSVTRPSPTAATFEISGTAVDGVRGQPVAHADIVIILGTGEDATQRMITGSDGRFRFTGLPAGKYQLIGEAAGYLRLGLDQHEYYFTGVVTGPGQVSTGITLKMQPEASISGRVLDSFGDPVADAQVMLFHRGLWNGSITTNHYAQVRTADQGEYRFGKLIPGTYYVAVFARPWYAARRGPFGQSLHANELDVVFPTTFHEASTQMESASAIVLRYGDAATANFTLSAVPAARVVLHTRDASISVSQFLLGGYENDIREYVEQRKIDDDTVELSGLPPGPLRLEVTPYGSEEATTRSLEFDSSAQQVDLGDLSLAPVARVIRGKVLEDGNPAQLGNSSLLLSERSTERIYSKALQADGSFTISNPEPGLYDVSITNFDAYVSSVNVIGGQLIARSVEFDGTSDVELTLDIKRDIASVPGIVLHGDKPQAGTMLLLVSDDYPQDTSLVRRDQSDADGTFTLRGVVPGRYTITAIKDGWDLEWVKPEVIQPYLEKGQHIQVQPKGKTPVKVKMQQAGAAPAES